MRKELLLPLAATLLALGAVTAAYAGDGVVRIGVLNDQSGVFSDSTGAGSTLALAIGKDRKGIISVVIYLSAILLSFVSPWIGLSLYTLVAAIWLVPDKRIEKKMTGE